MKIFKNILGFLGMAENSSKVELTEEQKEKIDAALGELDSIRSERDALKETVTGMETAATTSANRITELEGQVTSFKNDIVAKNLEILRLGSLDGTKFTTTTSQEEKKDEEKTEYSESHKQILAKAENM